MTIEPLDRVALLAHAETARSVLAELPLGEDIRVVPPHPHAAVDPRVRNARVAVACGAAAFIPAAAAQLLFGLPWVATFADGDVEEVERRRFPRKALGRATAVVAPAGVRARIEELVPNTRLVPREDPERVAIVLCDVALPREARPRGGTVAGAVGIGLWTFFDDRLTRLAIHLVRLTGKAPAPMHPHHLLSDSSHRWYAELVREGDRVLDVGCGHGAHAFELARRGARVVGIDVDRRGIAMARERAQREAIEAAEFHVADLSETASLDAFAPASFDVALALDVLEHLVDRHTVLVAIRRLLRNGGRLLLAVPNANTSYKRLRRRLGGSVYSNPDHKVEYDEPLLRAELERAGFEIERLTYGGYDTPFHGLGALLGALSLPLYRRLTARRHRVAQHRPERASAFRVVAVPKPPPRRIASWRASGG